MLTSVLNFAEVHAALARKLQERTPLRRTEYHSATVRFARPPGLVLDLIPDLVKKLFFTGGDAVPLASAWVRKRVEFGKASESLAEPWIVATSDKRLARAAECEQFEIFDPEDER